jgi:hypothetical protein
MFPHHVCTGNNTSSLYLVNRKSNDDAVIVVAMKHIINTT